MAKPRASTPLTFDWAMPVVVLLALLAMCPTLANGFTSWDDYTTIARNPYLAPPGLNTLKFYFTTPFMSLYVPFTYVVWGAVALAAQRDMPGLDGAIVYAFPFKFVNLALHAAASLLAYLLIRRLDRSRTHSPSWPAMIGAGLFACHPVQVEAVAWTSGLKDVLYACLSIGSIIGLDRALAVWDVVKRRAAWLSVGSTLFVFALLTKPTAVVVPGMAWLICVAWSHRSVLQTSIVCGAWTLGSVACAFWTSKVQIGSAAVQVAPLLRPLVALDSLAFYLGKLVWPTNLANDYGRSPRWLIASGQHHWTWVAPAAVAAMLLGTVAWRRRESIPLLVAVSIALAPLLPVLGFVPFDFQAYSSVADHYLYLPMLGVAGAVAWLLMCVRLGPVMKAIALVILLGLSALSMRQTTVWRDTQTLFMHTLAVNPRSDGSYNSLASSAIDRGDFGEAEQLARKAVELQPTSVNALLTLSLAQLYQGKNDDALATAQRAVAADERHAGAHAHLAGLLGQRGDVDGAIQHARRAVELFEPTQQAHLNLGIALRQKGDLRGAIEHMSRAIEIEPRYAEARLQLADVLMTTRQPGPALAQLDELLRRTPNYAPAVQMRQRILDFLRANKIGLQ
ncbi:MAG: tetratricopeptide repeat protein [Tepidisphaeraceae bacterium]